MAWQATIEEHEEETVPVGVVAGNVFDKYGSRNPIVRTLMNGFLRTLLRMVAPLAPKRILEVGCGQGQLLSYLRQHLSPDLAIGVDVSPQIVEEARRRWPLLSVGVASAYALPFPDRSFDLVVVSEVMEHLRNPRRALDEVVRVSGGCCLVSVPHEPWWRVLNVLRCRYLDRWGNTPGHIQHFSSSTFRHFLETRVAVQAFARPVPWLMALCGGGREEKEHG